METLLRQSRELLKYVTTDHVRNIYDEISWNVRLIGIKGARGVGKTTLLLQRMKLAFPEADKALYVSLDDLWFASHTLPELALLAEQKGVTHLFIDEVHRLPGWERQIKNVYDLHPGISVVFTGSSLLEIDHSIADLSRRCLMYTLHGLSFREYLEFEGHSFTKLSLQEIIYDHSKLTSSILSEVDVMKAFPKYLKHGFYPFYTSDSEADYLVRVNNMIASVIDYDIPAVENIEYSTLLKAKQLINVIASQSPSPLNAKLTAELMGVTKNQLVKIFSLLEKAQLLRLLYFKSERNPKSMIKPQKVLFDNPSIIYACGQPDKGKVRESFFASMLSVGHELSYPKDGDLLVDGRYLFEVGGARKGFTQIKDLPDSFVAADGIESGFGNKIPLWLFGFIY
ncbi:MAG: AAA family ATPase [Candidatus Amulumruptor caecigallinarius]|nr:AAA family ATPase [Candidatus Amulumruptor caecigallinarius]MCM1397008.1 AAA family ATPase [Candidatus Amulumruptor caecigallinarius]MCM1454634.1 AAA family ATPase [bacterium]